MHGIYGQEEMYKFSDEVFVFYVQASIYNLIEMALNWSFSLNTKGLNTLRNRLVGFARFASYLDLPWFTIFSYLCSIKYSLTKS